MKSEGTADLAVTIGAKVLYKDDDELPPTTLLPPSKKVVG